KRVNPGQNVQGCTPYHFRFAPNLVYMFVPWRKLRISIFSPIGSLGQKLWPVQILAISATDVDICIYFSVGVRAKCTCDMLFYRKLNNDYEKHICIEFCVFIQSENKRLKILRFT